MASLRRFEPAGYGPVHLGVVEAWWSSGGVVAMDPGPALEPPVPVAYSHAPYPTRGISRTPVTTRPVCACKFFGLGQGGCATPVEGAPVVAGGGSAPASGPSTLTIVGGVGVLGVLGLLAAGVI